MNTPVTERERRLVLALAEELAMVVGALLNVAATAGEIRHAEGQTAGWLLRWRLGGPLAGSLTAAIDEKAARELVGRLSGIEGPSTDETVASGLREVAGQVAGGLNRNPIVGGPFVASDVPPTPGVLEPRADAVTFDIATPNGFRMSVTSGATLDEAPDVVTDERGAYPPPTADGAIAPPVAPSNLGVILDIDLPLVVRFAQTSLTLQAMSRLGPGSILDLDRSPEDAVDVLVNGLTIARGEVVVVGGNYGVRITEVMNAVDRMRVMAS